MNRLARIAQLPVRFILALILVLLLAACGQPVTPASQPPTLPPSTPTPVKAANLITVAGDNWCPYNCEPGSELPGYMIEIATEVFKQAGYEVRYESVPWSRVVTGVEEGIYDAAVGAAKGDIPGAIFPEEELGSATNSLFVRKGDPWRYAGAESFKNIHLGVIGEYYYTDEINAYIEANKNSSQVDILLGDNAVERNLTKLLDKKIDVYIEDYNVAYYAANKIGLDKNAIEIAGSIDEPMLIYVAFSAKNPQSAKWAGLLSAGIKELRASGRLAEILKKYGMQDWK